MGDIDSNDIIIVTQKDEIIITQQNQQRRFVKKDPALGFFTLILAIITFFIGLILPVIGIILCYIIVIFGLIAIIRREKYITLSLSGMLLGGIIFWICIVLFVTDGYQEDIFSDRIFTMKDDSALYLYEDGTYEWYKDENDKDDNYYSGTYEIYHAEDAEEFILDESEENGVLEEELEDFYDRNEDNDLYSRENLYCLIMDCDYRMVDGEEIFESSEIEYFGFCDGNNYDLANMNTANYITITDVTRIEDENK